MRHLLLLSLACVAACFDASNAPSCTIACATDNDCTDGQTCNTQSGTCTAGEDCANPQTCTPGEFVACVDGSARACNANGDGTEDTACGMPGCNTAAKRCNVCPPSEVACSLDGTKLVQCSADGGEAMIAETCATNCVANTMTVPAHCRYLEPKWLPDICDMPATMATFMPNASATFSSDLDTNCTGGVVTQPPGRPICVVRYKTITIPQAVTLTISGTRPIAFVADDALTVNGTLDGAATTQTNGPGGGITVSGSSPSSGSGGGGAGYGSPGANGGGTGGAGTGNAGGAVSDPLALVYFGGGPHAPFGMLLGDTDGGGGGGAILLAACRGGVTLAATSVIDVGGGGGDPQFDQILGTGVSESKPGGGGGAGGYVAIEALTGVTASGGIFANGGGGGGGNTVDDGAGGPGGDGTRSVTVGGTGGGGSGNGSPGGRGASKGNSAATGGGTTVGASGGGGGGFGYVHVFAPPAATNSITNTNMSPNPTVRTTPTR